MDNSWVMIGVLFTQSLLVEEDSNLKQAIQLTECPLGREFYSNIYNV